MSQQDTVIPKALVLLSVCFFQSMVAWAVDYAQEAGEYVQQEFDAGRFVGSVMVARSNRIVFMNGYGLANREQNIPNASDTKFRLASLTKQFPDDDLFVAVFSNWESARTGEVAENLAAIMLKIASSCEYDPPAGYDYQWSGD